MLIYSALVCSNQTTFCGIQEDTDNHEYQFWLVDRGFSIFVGFRVVCTVQYSVLSTVSSIPRHLTSENGQFVVAKRNQTFLTALTVAHTSCPPPPSHALMSNLWLCAYSSGIPSGLPFVMRTGRESISCETA